jgi:hypothetical protein
VVRRIERGEVLLVGDHDDLESGLKVKLRLAPNIVRFGNNNSLFFF